MLSLLPAALIMIAGAFVPPSSGAIRGAENIFGARLGA